MTNDDFQFTPPAMPGESSANSDVEKVWWRRWWSITLGVFVAIMVLGAIVPSAEQDETVSSGAVDTAETPVKAEAPVANEVSRATEASTTTASPTTTAAPATTASPTTTAAPVTREPKPDLEGTPATVKKVVDGDTIYVEELDDSIRILGYDTPERGDCGYDQATNALTFLLGTGPVTITTDTGNDRDKYGRYLRHVLVGGVPVGLTMIESGNANARYDSLDGYPRHRYQDEYRAADGPNEFDCQADATVPVTQAPGATQAPVNNGPFKNCDAVRAAGRAPIRAGEPGFESKFDGDGDGIGCE